MNTAEIRQEIKNIRNQFGRLNDSNVQDYAGTDVEKMLRAFMNPDFKWRTLKGLADEAGIDEEVAAKIVIVLIDEHAVIGAKNPSPLGRKLYCLRGHDAADTIEVEEENQGIVEETHAPVDEPQVAVIASAAIPIAEDTGDPNLVYKSTQYSRTVVTFDDIPASGLEKVRFSKWPALVQRTTTPAEMEDYEVYKRSVPQVEFYMIPKDQTSAAPYIKYAPAL